MSIKYLFADNETDAEVTYELRRRTKEFDLPYSVKDIWTSRDHYYGRVDRGNLAVYPAQGYLTPLTKERNDLLALPFVSVALHNWYWYISRAINTKKINPRYSNIFPAKPVAAWSDVNTVYHSYARELEKLFLGSYKATHAYKVNSFKDFVEIYTLFLIEIANKTPFTKSSFIMSSYYDPHYSGLVFSLNQTEGNDRETRKWYKDRYFSHYLKSLRKYGFKVDKNQPWKVFADIESAPMRKIIEDIYDVSREEFFDIFYYSAHEQDFSLLKRYYFIVYNNFVKSVNQKYGKNLSYLKELSGVKELSEIEWLNVYVSIKNAETGSEIQLSKLSCDNIDKFVHHINTIASNKIISGLASSKPSARKAPKQLKISKAPRAKDPYVIPPPLTPLTVSVDLLENNSQFYDHTINIETIVSASLLDDSSDAFYAHTLNIGISASLLDDSNDTFYAPTLSIGVSASLLDDSNDTFYSHQIDPTISASLLDDSSDTFYAHTIGTVVSASLLDDSNDTFYAHTMGISVSASLLDDSNDTFYDHTMGIGVSASLLDDSSDTFYAHTVTVGVDKIFAGDEESSYVYESQQGNLSIDTVPPTYYDNVVLTVTSSDVVVAHYEMDEASGVLIDSGPNGYDGSSVDGSPTYETASLLSGAYDSGSAIYIDAGDGLHLGDPSRFNYIHQTLTGTISMWVKPESVVGDGSYEYLHNYSTASYDNTLYQGFAIRRTRFGYLAWDYWQFLLYSGSSTYEASVLGGTDVTIGDPQHLAAVLGRNDSNIYLFINGNEHIYTASLAGITENLLDAYTASFGERRGGMISGGNAGTGSIDATTFFSTPLTDQQVLDLYNSGSQE